MTIHTFNWKELRDAAEWAKAHAMEHHRRDGDPDGSFASFAVRNYGNSGIGINSAITCETCDKARVSNANTHEITDYECW